MRKKIAFKPYSKEDKDLIIQLWNENYSAKDIAEVTNRTAASIFQFIYTERKKGNPKLVEKKDDSKPKEKKTDLSVGGVKVASVPAKSVEKSTQQVAPPSSTTKPREMEPREMIKKLYDMGYRIENNKLVCYQKVSVKIDDIINNG